MELQDRLVNQRKGRKGAVWEDRYRATALTTDQYLVRCLVTIDRNMIRAGVMAYPEQWAESGYRQVHKPAEALPHH